MLSRRASVSTSIVISLCLIGGLVWSMLGLQQKPNQAIETLHPAKPVFLYVWDGFAAHQKTWNATAAKKALVDSGLGSQLDKLLTFFVAETGEPAVDLAHKLFMQLCDKGASISVALGESEGPPAPQVTIVLHDAASFETQLNKYLLERALKEFEPQTEVVAGRKVTRVAIPNSGGIEIGWWTDGGHVVIAGGIKGIEAALEVAQGNAPNLTTNPIVQKLRASKDFDVASVALVDVKSLLDLAREIPLPETAPGKAQATVGDIFKIAGIDRLGVITGRWGFKGEALWSETSLDAPAPLTGLMALFDQKPITISNMPAIPANCETFSLMRFDGSKFYEALLKAAQEGFDKFAPPDSPPLDQWISRANTAIGLDLKADLFEPLGDTVAFYMESGGLLPTATLLVKLDDADKINATFDMLEQKLISQLKNEEARGQIQFRTKQSAGGCTIHIVQISGQAFISPSWVVDGDWLVIGSTPQSVEAYLKRVDGKLPKWKPAPDLITAQEMLPTQFVSLSYSDPRSGIKTALGFAPTGIAFAEMGLAELRKARQRRGEEIDDSAEFPITPEDVPVADEVTAPLFANVSVCTVDAEGIHWHTRNSIPGLPIPGVPGGSGGIESVAVVGLVAAMMVPAYFQVQEVARRTQSTNNLRMLGIALHNYEASHRTFPQGTIQDEELNKPEDRLSWMVEILPSLEQATLYEQIQKAKAGRLDKSDTNLTYQLSTEPKDAGTIERMVSVIRRRIDPKGAKDLLVRPVGKKQIEIQIPHATRDEVEQIKSAVTSMGTLEFCVLADRRNPQHQRFIEQSKNVKGDLNAGRDGKLVVAGWRAVAPTIKFNDGKFVETANTQLEGDSNLEFRQIAGRPEGFKEVLCVFEPQPSQRVTGMDLVRCRADRDSTDSPCINFSLNPAGATKFKNLTSKYSPGFEGVGKYHLAILLNDMVQTAPVINEPIHAEGQISGNFTSDDVNQIVNLLNAGPLEIPLQKAPISEEYIDVPNDGKNAKRGFNDEAYKDSFQQQLSVFVNPNQVLIPDPKGYALTTYVGIAGVGRDAALLKNNDPKAGIFGYDRKTAVRDIRDGMSNTLMVTEAFKDLGPWAQGGSATIRGLATKPYINGPDGIGGGKGSGGVNVLFADGSVRSISENVDPKVFEALSTKAGGEVIEDDF